MIDVRKLDDPGYLGLNFLDFHGAPSPGFADLEDPNVQMDLAWQHYRQSRSAQRAFDPPPYLDNVKALDLVYRKLARNLAIKVKTPSSRDDLPVMWYGKRKFQVGKDRLTRSRVEFGRNGKLQLVVAAHSETYLLAYRQNKPGLPPVKLVLLDTSASMQAAVQGDDPGIIMNPWAPDECQWSDHSKYHHAMVAFYRLVEFCKKKGALKRMPLKLVNYSNLTQVASGWTSAARLAFSPQFGGYRS